MESLVSHHKRNIVLKLKENKVLDYGYEESNNTTSRGAAGPLNLEDHNFNEAFLNICVFSYNNMCYRIFLSNGKSYDVTPKILVLEFTHYKQY